MFKFDERWMLIIYHLQIRKLEIFDVEERKFSFNSEE